MNRLEEVLKSNQVDRKAESEVGDPDVEKRLSEFNKKVSTIETSFSEIEKLSSKLKEGNVKLLQSTVSKDKAELKKQNQNMMKDISAKNKIISTDLETLGKEIEKRKEELKGAITAEVRIKESKHTQLVQKFRKTVAEYQEMQEDFKKKNTERAIKEIKLANPTISDDEVKKLMQTQELDEKKSVLSKSQQSTLDTYYNEAVETRRDVQLIEQSLIELQELFIIMEKMVDQQDQLLDNVEANVERSVTSMERGVKMLEEANQMHIHKATGNFFSSVNEKLHYVFK